MKLYTVNDLASKTFTKPFVMLTDRDAIEGFRHVCNEPETPYAKHPQDYTLVNIGSFDERTGVLTLSDSQLVLARALDLKHKKLNKEQIANKIAELKLELEGAE